MPPQKFTVKLEKAPGMVEAACFSVPFDVKEVFGTRARVAVRGTINGFAYRSSIFPMGKNGCHMMAVNKEMREGAGAGVGDTAEIVMDLDTAPRTVTIPPELKKALAKNKQARTLFDRLSYTHRKEFARWVTEAKRPETRAQRLAKVVPMLLRGETL
jgi:Bacteriocin-protection, YdeI or OmpD-Associated/Domain of unknown function (DUF1905)